MTGMALNLFSQNTYDPGWCQKVIIPPNLPDAGGFPQLRKVEGGAYIYVCVADR